MRGCCRDYHSSLSLLHYHSLRVKFSIMIDSGGKSSEESLAWIWIYIFKQGLYAKYQGTVIFRVLDSKREFLEYWKWPNIIQISENPGRYYHPMISLIRMPGKYTKPNKYCKNEPLSNKGLMKTQVNTMICFYNCFFFVLVLHFFKWG